MNHSNHEVVSNEKSFPCEETRVSNPQLASLHDDVLPAPAPSPPPDGGWNAWMQVFAAHQVMMNTSACTNAFGFFQTFYTASLHASPSAISWVGGTQAFLIMFLGAFSGRIVDAGFYRYLMISGLGLQIVGIFATSLVSNYWQFFLAQGICQGIGGGLVLVPTMAIVSSLPLSATRGIVSLGWITAYAEDILHISPEASISLLLTINALGVPGRFVPSFISDWYLGPQNTLTITVFLAALLMFIWISIDSISGMWAFAVAYGLVTANIQSLTAPSLMSAGRDPTKIGAEIGMIFALLSIGMLCGPPISGVLIEKNGGDYLYAQIYAGGIILCGSISFAAARLLCSRQLLKQI